MSTTWVQIIKALWYSILVVAMLDGYIYFSTRQKVRQYSEAEVTVTTTSSPAVQQRQALKSGQDPFQSFCTPHKPCMYPDSVDLRVIVMTYNRAQALKIVLESVEGLELDGRSASVEIFIDRSKKTGAYDNKTLNTAREFQWSRGKTRVHVWASHVGLYGQWIDTWRPQPGSKELAIILEDDVVVSKYAYRWLRSAHSYYGNRTDVQGYTFQSQGIASAKGAKPLSVQPTATSYMYRVLGSWGFAPHPTTWVRFQDWYHSVKSNTSFHPYVPGLRMTAWYRDFEARGKQDGMWTMWYIYYTDQNKLYCVYNNLNKYLKTSAACLAVHRAEPGLHYGGKPNNNQVNLLKKWSDDMVKFPQHTQLFDYDGKPITT